VRQHALTGDETIPIGIVVATCGGEDNRNNRNNRIRVEKEICKRGRARQREKDTKRARERERKDRGHYRLQ
jgi:hypothetical protein